MKATRQVIDPAGLVRCELPAAASLEDFLRLAWALGPRDLFVVIASATHQWGLSIYRPGPHAMVDPTFSPLGIRTGYIAQADSAKTLAAMMEAAWLDLVDEGWSIRDAAA